MEKLERLYKKVWKESPASWSVVSIEKRFIVYAKGMGFTENQIDSFLKGLK